MRRLLHFVATVFLLTGSSLPAIAADNATIAIKDLVGNYYFGDGTGVNCSLKLTRRGEFTFQWHGCLGTYDTNNGRANIKDGVLQISPKKTNSREGFQGTPTDFFPVRWGSWMYLIPTNEIVAFCSDVNQGSEPRSINFGQYYLRQNDWDKPVSGKPAVPEQWARYFLSRPVRGQITQLIGKQEAWIDVGADAGLLEGMILTAQSHEKTCFRKCASKPWRKVVAA